MYALARSRACSHKHIVAARGAGCLDFNKIFCIILQMNQGLPSERALIDAGVTQTPGDYADRILDFLHEQVFGERSGGLEGEEANQHCYALFEGGDPNRIIAALAISMDEDGLPEASLDYIGADPHARRHGAASELRRRVEHILAGLGAVSITAQPVSEEATPFLLANGYCQMSPTDEALSKWLPPAPVAS